MNFKKLLVFILIISAIILAIRTVSVIEDNKSRPKEIMNSFKKTKNQLLNEFETKRKQLLIEHVSNKYLASGGTAYDRIFNTKNQTILELIDNIALEALPKDWKHYVRAEEFTHFILLIYPNENGEYNITEISKLVLPIIKYCGDYLQNIAVYNRNRKCYLFFDNEIISTIIGKPEDIPKLEQKAKEMGQSFERFNSFTIKCEKVGGHLIVPITVSCSDSEVICNALLDTGASITMLSKDVVSATVEGDYEYYTQKTFYTANGEVKLPIVTRKIKIGSFEKSIRVAVNEKDGTNILGLNFFENFNHIIDFSNSCIYIWEK